MASKCLKLNDDNTELIVLGTLANLARVATEAINVEDRRIAKVTTSATAELTQQ